MTKTAIRLKTKQQFKDETCYIPQENCFISLDRAIEYGYEIQQ